VLCCVSHCEEKNLSAGSGPPRNSHDKGSPAVKWAAPSRAARPTGEQQNRPLRWRQPAQLPALAGTHRLSPRGCLLGPLLIKCCFPLSLSKPTRYQLPHKKRQGGAWGGRQHRGAWQAKHQKCVFDRIWGAFPVIAKPVSRNPSHAWPSTTVLKRLPPRMPAQVTARANAAK